MSLLARGYPREVDTLGRHVGHPELKELIRRFLSEQLHDTDGFQVELDDCPEFSSSVFVYHSAVSTFFAPSDESGIGGMRQERIRATPTWFNGRGRHDTILLEADPEVEGFAGLHVARVLMFLSFTHARMRYPCALIHWYSAVGNDPCELTGMWKVQPDFKHDGTPYKAIVHMECILRAAHLMPVYGAQFLAEDFSFEDTLDTFRLLYVNKFIDHHANEIVF
jgi:hypothetical protein